MPDFVRAVFEAARMFSPGKESIWISLDLWLVDHGHRGHCQCFRDQPPFGLVSAPMVFHLVGFSGSSPNTNVVYVLPTTVHIPPLVIGYHSFPAGCLVGVA